MSNFEKKDLTKYNGSEIIYEFEKRILETLSRVDILQNKIAQMSLSGTGGVPSASQLNATTEATNKATEAMKKFKQVVNNPADDSEAEVVDDAETEAEVVDDADDNLLAELKDMCKKAADAGDIKLAYRIERTIDELLEEQVKCE